ncbi:MAG: copper-binding protein [Rhodobacteraceae bacterium]|nr:copper-binding protein [Paracoccaceae bacterium]
MLLTMCLALVPAVVWASKSESHTSPALTATLISAEDGVAPSAGTISAGLDIRMRKDWKVYWRSPGEVGYPPTVDWTGSTNLAGVTFLWPAPKRFSAFGIENYGYHDEIVFPLSIHLKQPGTATQLKARVSLLVCSDICVPDEFVLALDLPAGTGIDAASGRRISTFAARVPDDGRASGISIEAANVSANPAAVTLTARSTSPFRRPDVFPELGAQIGFGKPDIRLGDDGRFLWARLPILSPKVAWRDLTITITDGSRAATITPALSARVPQPPFAAIRRAPGLAKLLWIGLLAALGGLILNVMPCVLPVLSIKLASAMNARDGTRARIRQGFLVSSAGVMAFMWVLAAATIGLRALGFAVGWGLQFQSPVFLAAMILVMALFSANLFGAFEISLPSSWQTSLARADGRAGVVADFLTGALSAVLATPCSAPFLGTAVAFALSGRPVDIAMIFTALGIGLSFPYLLVAAAPGIVARLPRPGRWMLVLKVLLGALLVATALWLLWVLNGVAGLVAVGAVVAGATGLTMVLALRGARWLLRSGAAVAVIAATLVAAGVTQPAASSAGAQDTAWVNFDRVKIARLVSTGKVVFVDVTADWCLTCKANKTLVLDREPVRSALMAPGVVPMLADWTRPNEAITSYLKSFGRYGIPFNAVYGPGAPGGIVLPELLSSEAVLDALQRAGTRLAEAGGGP